MNGNATVVRSLVDLRDRTLQKNRVAFGLRIDAVERGADTMETEQVDILHKWQDVFAELEAQAESEICGMMKDEPVIIAMVSVKGIGVMLAAKVSSMIDIDRATTVSALWRYAGYGVVDGEREKPTKGEKLHYNARLKTSCYLVATSFLRCNSPYRRIYDDAREYYLANRPEWTKAHQHNAAMRKMIKVWLSHLWEVWREIEGKPVRNLYAIDRLGHEHYISPREFGWEY
jgi:hypothetical protein